MVVGLTQDDSLASFPLPFVNKVCEGSNKRKKLYSRCKVGKNKAKINLIKFANDTILFLSNLRGKM